MVSAKVIVPFLAVGASTASIGGYLYANSRKEVTVFDKVKESLKDHYRILSSKSDVAWVKFKEVYKASSGKQIFNVSEEQISGWCETTLKEVFSKEKYDHAIKWCVIYDRSIKDSLGKSVLTADKSDEKWKKAWDKFSSGNASSLDLKIEDEALAGNSKPSGRDSGGIALNKWCTDRYDMKMYELGADDLSKKVERWCNVDQGSDS